MERLATEGHPDSCALGNLTFVQSHAGPTMRNRELDLKAMQMLESPESYPGLAERRFARTLVRIWRYPSFGPYSSWTLIQVKSQMFLRRVIWDRSDMLAITPVTFGSEAQIEAPAYEGLLLRLREMQLSPFITVARLGLDGTTYGIETSVFGLAARLSWWETPPPEWAALGTWHAEAVETFAGLLPASTATFDQR